MTSNAPRTPLSGPQRAERPLSSDEQPTRPRWALYARSGGADERATTFQLEALRAFVAREGGEVAGEYVDLGPARAGRDALLERLERRGGRRRWKEEPLDGVAAFDVPRLGRRNRDLEAWLELFETKELRNTRLTVLHGPADRPYECNTSEARLVLRMSLTLSEYSRETVREWGKLLNGEA